MHIRIDPNRKVMRVDFEKVAIGFNLNPPSRPSWSSFEGDLYNFPAASLIKFLVSKEHVAYQITKRQLHLRNAGKGPRKPSI